jgi:cysteinyl-tRNA synthetase
VALRIYNTLTSKKEDFVPRVPGKVGIYVCGPTVQDRSHIGHARVYTAFDVVVKWLRAKGLAVTHVRNFTDVDDKIIRKANERGIPVTELTAELIELFWKEMDALNIARPDVAPKVTEHIPEIIQITEKLVAKEAAYKSEGDVYFAVKAYAPYGKLSKRNLDDLQAGASERVDAAEPRKRDPLDFALWKKAKPGEPLWQSPFGEGRPGWHIECSAMAAKYLGESFDIHAGGKDLIFPHHENELAQSEAASGKTFANYWMHNGFVSIRDEVTQELVKMAKSGISVSLGDMLNLVSPEAVRAFLLGTHYRNPIDFSIEAIQVVEGRTDYEYETLVKLDAKLAIGKDPGPGPVAEAAKLDAIEKAFGEHLDDDFNTAGALGAIAELFALANQLADQASPADKAGTRRALQRIRALVGQFGAVLGLWQKDPAVEVARRRLKRAVALGIDVAWVEAQIAARAAARAAKDFKRSDELRNDLKAKQIEIMDNPGGTTWKVA